MGDFRDFPPYKTNPSPYHFVSAAMQGWNCSCCGEPATHKVGEYIPHDDPQPIRHELTTTLCCVCYSIIMGPSAAYLCGVDPVWLAKDGVDSFKWILRDDNDGEEFERY